MLVQQKVRHALDITMTVLSVILMGGVTLFPEELVHEILGMVLSTLWVLHVIFNYRFYGAIFKGKYNARRVVQTVVNVCILLCAFLLAVSGLMMKYADFGMSFARTVHLICSHWYYIFMSLHIGLHIKVIARRMFKNSNGKPRWILRIVFILISVYGLYAFFARGIWKYMFYTAPFFFLDLENGYLLFAVDYLSIMIMLATAIFWTEKGLGKKRKWGE